MHGSNDDYALLDAGRVRRTVIGTLVCIFTLTIIKAIGKITRWPYTFPGLSQYRFSRTSSFIKGGRAVVEKPWEQQFT